MTLFLLLATAPALAWAPGDGKTAAIGAIDDVAFADLGGATIVVATGATGTSAVGADGAVVASTPTHGQRLATWVQAGTTYVALCGADGVRLTALTSSGFSSPKRATDQPCADVGVVDDPERRTLVVAGSSLETYPLDGTTVGAGTPLPAVLAGWDRVAASGSRFAATQAGATQVVEQSELGRSILAAGGPVGDVAWGTSLSWTLPGRAEIGDVTHARAAVAAQPSRLAAADVDGDGQLDLVVLHDGDRAGVLLGDGTERLFEAPAGTRALAAGDVDGDGCGDVVFATATGLVTRVGRCDDPPVVATIASTSSGMDVAPSADVAKPADVAPSDVIRSTGDGEAAPPPLSASDAPGTLVLDGHASLRVRVGETAKVRLATPSGEARHYAGRGGPPGLVVLPDGLLRYQAHEGDVGRWSLSIRAWGGTDLLRVETLTIDVVAADAPDAPVVASADADADTPEERPTWPLRARTRSHSGFDACVAAAGVAGGASAQTTSWSSVGAGPVLASASPAASLACEVGGGGARLFLGFDSAPTFEYLAAADVKLIHLAAGTAGVSFGGSRFDFGPYGTIGLVVMGLGARVEWLPFGPADSAKGFQLRATWLVPSTPAFEGMLLFAWRM